MTNSFSALFVYLDMSSELKTGLQIIDNLTTQTELALLIAAASKRIIELNSDEDLIITEELKKRIDAIEARHARGDGITYSKHEFRQHLDNLMDK